MPEGSPKPNLLDTLIGINTSLGAHPPEDFVDAERIKAKIEELSRQKPELPEPESQTRVSPFAESSESSEPTSQSPDAEPLPSEPSDEQSDIPETRVEVSPSEEETPIFTYREVHEAKQRAHDTLNRFDELVLGQFQGADTERAQRLERERKGKIAKEAIGAVLSLTGGFFMYGARVYELTGQLVSVTKNALFASRSTYGVVAGIHAGGKLGEQKGYANIAQRTALETRQWIHNSALSSKLEFDNDGRLQIKEGQNLNEQELADLQALITKHHFLYQAGVRLERTNELFMAHENAQSRSRIGRVYEHTKAFLKTKEGKKVALKMALYGGLAVASIFAPVAIVAAGVANATERVYTIAQLARKRGETPEIPGIENTQLQQLIDLYEQEVVIKGGAEQTDTATRLAEHIAAHQAELQAQVAASAGKGKWLGGLLMAGVSLLSATRTYAHGGDQGHSGGGKSTEHIVSGGAAVGGGVKGPSPEQMPGVAGKTSVTPEVTITPKPGAAGLPVGEQHMPETATVTQETQATVGSAGQTPGLVTGTRGNEPQESHIVQGRVIAQHGSSPFIHEQTHGPSPFESVKAPEVKPPEVPHWPESWQNTETKEHDLDGNGDKEKIIFFGHDGKHYALINEVDRNHNGIFDKTDQLSDHYVRVEVGEDRDITKIRGGFGVFVEKDGLTTTTVDGQSVVSYATKMDAINQRMGNQFDEFKKAFDAKHAGTHDLQQQSFNGLVGRTGVMVDLGHTQAGEFDNIPDQQAFFDPNHPNELTTAWHGGDGQGSGIVLHFNVNDGMKLNQASVPSNIWEAMQQNHSSLIFKHLGPEFDHFQIIPGSERQAAETLLNHTNELPSSMRETLNKYITDQQFGSGNRPALVEHLASRFVRDRLVTYEYLTNVEKSIGHQLTLPDGSKHWVVEGAKINIAGHDYVIKHFDAREISQDNIVGQTQSPVAPPEQQDLPPPAPQGETHEFKDDGQVLETIKKLPNDELKQSILNKITERTEQAGGTFDADVGITCLDENTYELQFLKENTVLERFKLPTDWAQKVFESLKGQN